MAALPGDGNESGKATGDGCRPIRELGRARSKLGRFLADRLVVALLIGCAAFSIATTFAIIFLLAQESFRFFTRFDDVSFLGFVGGLEWNPLLGSEKHFGIWPLIVGTLLVTGVSAVVSLPLGLITAIFLSEYAPHRLRSVLKPVLEILAGVPTVVYGFFALLVITPALQGVLGLVDGRVNFYNVMSAGLAVGIMCLPIVCSLSEDALRAVPRSLREGAHALGSTKFDVSVRVVTPAALSGIVAAFLLAISRAVGETMIVALAAGNRPVQFFRDRMAQNADGENVIAGQTFNPGAFNPLDQAQTMTAYMVQIFLGDAGHFSAEYYSSYAVAGTLFVMTLVLTIIGNRVLKRFREEYE